MGTLILRRRHARHLGVARLCSRFDVCSKALYYASYLFFYGQNGFMVLYGGTKGGTGEEDAGGPEDARINDTAYAVFVLCLATLASTVTEVVDYACAVTRYPRG